MRPELRRTVEELFEIRRGQFDMGHAETLTREQVESLVRQVEREAREDVYAEIGVEPLRPDEVVVRLNIGDLRSLQDACSITMSRYTDPRLSSFLSIRLLMEMNNERQWLNAAWSKISTATEQAKTGKEGNA